MQEALGKEAPIPTPTNKLKTSQEILQPKCYQRWHYTDFEKFSTK
jgi:hypothetical protein